MDDYRYFKYRLINKNLIDSLVNESLYFALPSKLNDPFDCQIDLRKSANFAASKVSGVKRKILLKIAGLDTFVDKIQHKMTKIGGCSFSLSLEESLLWSHYADEHRGICLLYEFTESFFLDEMNEIVGVSNIEYGENPLSDWLIESIPEQIADDFYDQFIKELLKRVLIVKADGDYGRVFKCYRRLAYRILKQIFDAIVQYCRSLVVGYCFFLQVTKGELLWHIETF